MGAPKGAIRGGQPPQTFCQHANWPLRLASPEGGYASGRRSNSTPSFVDSPCVNLTIRASANLGVWKASTNSGLTPGACRQVAALAMADARLAGERRRRNRFRLRRLEVSSGRHFASKQGKQQACTKHQGPCGERLWLGLINEFARVKLCSPDNHNRYDNKTIRRCGRLGLSSRY